MMRTAVGRLKWLIALLLLAVPAVASAQIVPPADPLIPLPLGGTEEGGPYLAFQFVLMNQTNPLKQQIIGFRGFVDSDGSVTGSPPGTFVGSKEPALGTQQVSGPGAYEPGFVVHGGWRFEDGVTVDVSWLHLVDTRYSATASLVPVDFLSGGQLADSFVSAPVYNFPSNYAGPARKVALGDNFAVYGIWNGAGLMTEELLQRFDQADVTARIPIYQTDCWRTYGLVGGRAVIMWERFQWLTVDYNLNGVSTPTDQATYNNIVSNRLYGPHVGCGNEWYCGSTPLGAFSVSLDLDAGLFWDIVKERAGYQLGDRSTAAHRNRDTYTIAPELMADIAGWWYPTQGIQIRFGYDIMAFFNTISSPQPVDFNYGAIDPSYVSTLRLFSGFNFGIGFAF